MIICPICHSQNSNDNHYCTMCGNRLPEESTRIPDPPVFHEQPRPTYPAYDPYDHTASFDAQDIAANKLYALAMYVLSFVGIIIALLGAKESAYVQFHLRQNLKILILEAVLGVCAAVLAITVIIPIIAGIGLLVIEVVKVICFFQVCSGKAKDPVIIRSLGFLN